MMTEWTSELREHLDRLARDAGFDLAGVAAAYGADDITAARFTGWVEAGRAGEMEYLKRRDEQGILLRSDVRVAIPWARSVIVCALNYNANAPRSLDSAPAEAGWIARYAWSGKDVDGELRPSDYHDYLLTRLRQVEAGLREQAQYEMRCYVDTGPILERDFAAKAGVGWIGKNTCVLNQGLGSWLLLGVIVCSLPVPDSATLDVAADRCGSCTRCIDACPTNALVAPREMDASLCISYLTIEKKGSIPEELREAMGRQVFGCDICQDVCPWNRKAPIAQTSGIELRRALVNPSLSWLGGMDVGTFKHYFKGSPLERTKLKRLQRNVALAMGNSRSTEFLAQLELWATRDDAVLAESARWAIAQILRKEEEGEQGLPLC